MGTYASTILRDQSPRVAEQCTCVTSSVRPHTAAVEVLSMQRLTQSLTHAASLHQSSPPAPVITNVDDKEEPS